MGCTQHDGDARRIGQPIDHEVTIRRERVEAGPGVDRWAQGAGQVALHERRHPLERRLVPLERPGRGRGRRAAEVLGDLWTGLAIRREAVEARFVLPDPDREPVRGKRARIRAGEVGHLLLRDLEREAAVEVREELVGPGIGRDHDSRRPVRRAVLGGNLVLAAARVADPGHGRPFEERRPAPGRQVPMRPVPADRIRQPAFRLEQPCRGVVDLPLRPAAPDLVGVEQVERDAFGRETAGVVVDRVEGVARPQVEATGHGHDPLPGLRLDLRPAGIGAPRKPDVVGPIVRVADDPAVILRGPVRVPQLELFQAEDAVAKPRAQPVGRSRADPAEPDDDRVPVASPSVVDLAHRGS